MIDGGETTELIPPFYFQLISQWEIPRMKAKINLQH